MIDSFEEFFSAGRRYAFFVSTSDHVDIVAKWLYYRLNYQNRKEFMLPASFLPSRPCRLGVLGKTLLYLAVKVSFRVALEEI